VTIRDFVDTHHSVIGILESKTMVTVSKNFESLLLLWWVSTFTFHQLMLQIESNERVIIGEKSCGQFCCHERLV